MKEIKKDITFYKKFNLRADYLIEIDGAPLETVLKKITVTLDAKENISSENIV